MELRFDNEKQNTNDVSEQLLSHAYMGLDHEIRARAWARRSRRKKTNQNARSPLWITYVWNNLYFVCILDSVLWRKKTTTAYCMQNVLFSIWISDGSTERRLMVNCWKMIMTLLWSWLQLFSCGGDVGGSGLAHMLPNQSQIVPLLLA